MLISEITEQQVAIVGTYDTFNEICKVQIYYWTVNEQILNVALQFT